VALTNVDLPAAIRGWALPRGLLLSYDVLTIAVPALLGARGDGWPLAEHFSRGGCAWRWYAGVQLRRCSRRMLSFGATPVRASRDYVMPLER